MANATFAAATQGGNPNGSVVCFDRDNLTISTGGGQGALIAPGGGPAASSIR